MPNYKSVSFRLKGVGVSTEKAPPKKTLVTAIKKGFWTPRKVTDEIANKLQAERIRLTQMQGKIAHDLEDVEPLMALMGNGMPLHPNSLESEELKQKIGYVNVIVAVMQMIPVTRSFDDATNFLHYLRDEAWKRGPLGPKSKGVTIFDVVDGCGLIICHPTAGKASFYSPPPELVDAANFFLRERHYKASHGIGDQRVVKLDDQTSIINLDADDRPKEVLGVPNQRVTVLGAASNLPQWALMIQNGQTLGLFRRAAQPHAFVIYNGDSAKDACKYEAY